MNIAVVDIDSSGIRYSGKSTVVAAEYLRPGRTWGTGHTKIEAEAVAKAKAEGFRRRGYKFRPIAEVRR